jgi:hypothetical protein
VSAYLNGEGVQDILIVGKVHGFKIVTKRSQNFGNNNVMLREAKAINPKYHSFKNFT